MEMLRNRLPELALLLVVVVWASTFVLTKQAFYEISPLAFAFVRFAGITLLAFGVLATSVQFALQKSGFGRFRRFSPQGRRLDLGYYMRGAANRTPAA